MVNAWQEPLTFELPAASLLRGNTWSRWLDTSLPPPSDIVPLDDVLAVESRTYVLPPYSLAVMLARATTAAG
jgi:glycogen operon protein